MRIRWSNACAWIASTAVLVSCSDTQTKSAPEKQIDPPPSCDDLFSDGKQARLDASGQGQLQADLAFDGTAIWAAYDQVDPVDPTDPDASRGFDIWATRLGCDGSVLTAPFRVNSATKTNDLDPAIAIGHGVVLVAWLTDSGEFPNNLTIRYRLYRTDGTAVMADERILKTTVSGAQVDANTWQHSIAATPTGFAIAGTRAPVDTGGFQVFVQRIDDQGNPVGETIDGHSEADVSHQNAAIASHEDGTLFVGWARTHDIDDLEPYHAKIAPSGTTMLPDPPIAAVSGRTGAYPTMAAPASGPAYLAFQSEEQGISDILVKDATVFNGESPVLDLTVNHANSFAPRVAAADAGGAVAWFVQPSGDRYLAVRRFSYDGTTWSRGPMLSITADAGQVAPAVPGLVHLSGNRYFVTWAEGASPNYVLQGRFIALEAQ